MGGRGKVKCQEGHARGGQCWRDPGQHMATPPPGQQRQPTWIDVGFVGGAFFALPCHHAVPKPAFGAGAAVRTALAFVQFDLMAGGGGGGRALGGSNMRQAGQARPTGIIGWPSSPMAGQRTQPRPHTSQPGCPTASLAPLSTALFWARRSTGACTGGSPPVQWLCCVSSLEAVVA